MSLLGHQRLFVRGPPLPLFTQLRTYCCLVAYLFGYNSSHGQEACFA
jgi:hypothetical protein